MLYPLPALPCPVISRRLGGQALARERPTELKPTSVPACVYERCRQQIRSHTEHVFTPFYEDGSIFHLGSEGKNRNINGDRHRREKYRSNAFCRPTRF